MKSWENKNPSQSRRLRRLLRKWDNLQRNPKAWAEIRDIRPNDRLRRWPIPWRLSPGNGSAIP